MLCNDLGKFKKIDAKWQPLCHDREISARLPRSSPGLVLVPGGLWCGFLGDKHKPYERGNVQRRERVSSGQPVMKFGKLWGKEPRGGRTNKDIRKV